jgi:hypothetical protein
MSRGGSSPLLAITAALVLALGGCGADGLGAGELRARAGAICRDTTATIARIPPPSTPDASARFLRSGATELRRALARLARLKPPPALRTRYAQALGLAARDLAAIEQSQHELAAGADPVGTVRALQRRLDARAQLEDATWRALELPACVLR